MRLSVIIDILIESEKLEARPGWSKRVKVLHEFSKQAAIVTDIQSTKERKMIGLIFPQSAHEFQCDQPEQQ